jgi:peptide/nickel transport system ATP-binding protein
MKGPIIELQGVSKRFSRKHDVIGRLATRLGLAKPEPEVRAVDNVNLRIMPGQVVGLVGESGCGKSTLGRMIAGILPMSDGKVLYRGKNVGALTPQDRKLAMLGVQMIFQDPYASLNPRMRVRDIIGEAAEVHDLIEGDYQDYVTGQLRQVGLDPVYSARYPHQFSGGQRQRIGIARALAVRPDFLVCDEAVASLDVSIQAQVLNLFMDLRDSFDLTYLFVSHNLAVVQHLSDRVAIMYLGRLIEEGSTDDIFRMPAHPYTQALLSELPRINVRRKSFAAIKGELPTPLSPPSGCHFHPRCPHAMPRCSVEVPQFREVAPAHRSACHLNDLG